MLIGPFPVVGSNYRRKVRKVRKGSSIAAVTAMRLDVIAERGMCSIVASPTPPGPMRGLRGS
jgi:hypothetical protein